MNVIVYASVSSGTPWWPTVRPNREEYCERHGYEMVEVVQNYDEALTDQSAMLEALGRCDLLWTLDSDCVITNMTIKIDAVDCLGPHATICREGHDGPLLNAGSMVWRNTAGSRRLAAELCGSYAEWKDRRFLSQDWLCDHHERLSDVLKVVPEKTFNSVWPIWRKGHFVFHGCGQGPNRAELLQGVIDHLVTR